ncbi:MAG: SLBB domain-containing protein [Candidatus Methylomirabilales bacterium]
MKKLIPTALIVCVLFSACVGLGFSQQRIADRLQQQAGQFATTIAKQAAALPRIGYDAFKIDVTKIPPGPVDKSYVLSPGDKIILSVWGQLQFSHKITVTNDLYLEIPDVPGRVYVSDLPLSQVEDRVRRQMATVYATYFNPDQPAASSAFIDIALEEVHDLRFLVQGEVATPGSYALHPSLANIIYALASAGGVKESGSLRNIKIRRGDRVVNFDFYDFLIRGKVTRAQTQIRNNDVIFVPLKRKEVTIRGEVKRPGIYELQEAGEEDFEALLDIAGGLKPTASLEKLLILRTQLNEGLSTLDINLQEARQSHRKVFLQDQDIVTVFPTYQVRLDYVSIRGKGIAVPGEYQMKPQMTVNDLIHEAGGLLRDAYMDRADLVRTRPDMTKVYRRVDLRRAADGAKDNNLRLQPLDELIVYNVRDIEGEQKFITLRGHVKYPGHYEYYRGMHVYDLLFGRGGFQDKDFLRETYLERADLVRAVAGGNRRELLKFHLGKLLDGDTNENLELQSDDEIVIYSQQDILGGDRYVTLSGHAKNPGQHRLYEGMRLFDLLYTAGGYQDPDYRRQAFHPRGDVIRKVRRDGELTREILRFNLGELLDGNPEENLELESGDEVVLYAAGDFQDTRTVEINGQVRHPGRYPWSSNMTLADLLLQAGGPLEAAMGSRAEIARLDPAANPEPRTQSFTVQLQEDFYRQPQVVGFALKSNDKVFIRKNPAFEVQRSVEVAGEVLYPGRYVLDKPETLVSEIIARAGGLKPEAFPEGAVLMREKRVDQETKRERIVFRKDAILQDGDRLEIPKFENVIRIEGAVKNPITVTFQPGKRVKDYLEMAGGFTADADRRGIQVIGPEGAAVKEKGRILFWRGSKLRPGTVILVPRIYRKEGNP